MQRNMNSANTRKTVMIPLVGFQSSLLKRVVSLSLREYIGKLFLELKDEIIDYRTRTLSFIAECEFDCSCDLQYSNDQTSIINSIMVNS